MNNPFRRFRLVRTEDESGVSGTGTVAVGCQFPSGFVHMEWLNNDGNETTTSRNGIAQYPGAATDEYDSPIEAAVADVDAIHGHDGRTEIRWVDDGMDQYPDWQDPDEVLRTDD